MSERTPIDQGGLVEQLQTLVDCTSDMLSLLDPDFRYIAVNQAYGQMFGLTPQDFPGKLVAEIFAHEPLYYQNVIRPLLESVKAGVEQYFAQWVEVPGRGRTYLELSYVPVRNAGGSIVNIAVTGRDKTEVMRSLEALQQSEKILKRTENLAHVGGWWVDVATGIMQWTEEMYAIYEVDKDFVLTAANVEAFLQPDAVERVHQSLALAMAGTPVTQNEVLTTRNGTRKWIHSVTFPVLKDGKVVVIEGMMQDVTDLVEMQSGISRAQRLLDRHRYILDQHAIVTVTDVRGVITHVNDKFVELTGYSRDELLGSNHSMLRSGIHSARFVDELWSVILAGDIWQGDACCKAKSGQLFWIQSTIVPVKDEAGNIEEFISLSADISRLKQAEASLQRAQKMEAVGQLSGGIAHDFNNLLGIIVGNLELAELLIPADSAVRSQLENARNAAMRGSVLTRRLLNFSRQAPVLGASLDVNRVLIGLEALISKSLTALVSVDTRLDPQIGLVAVDAGDFEDAMINLAINAGDAMPNGGNLSFRTRNYLVEQTEHHHTSELLPGRYVEICVSDTGVGIARELQDRIFEPYFTTKPGDKGTGLGLSMVYGFVRRSKGCIVVDSRPGKGTKFSLYLQCIDSDQTIDHIEIVKATEPVGSGNQETILLVDDEEEILTITTLHLQNLGYRVLSCSSGDAAMLILQGQESIDLLFTDVVMPGRLNGIELAEAALALRPGLKVLVTTGYARVQNQQILDRWNHSLIHKPYRSAELSRKIRDLLDN